MPFTMRLSDKAQAAPYQCLVEDSSPPDMQMVRELAKILMDQYTSKNLGVAKWRKHPRFVIDWTDHHVKPSVQRQSIPLTFNEFVEHLIKFRAVRGTDLGVTSPERAQANWMDADVTWWGHYSPESDKQIAETLTVNAELKFGATFPVTPGIDREGFMTSSPQLHLQLGLLQARARILKEAPAFVPQVINRERGEHAQFIFGGTPPLAALTEYLNLFVSIVDITLMQAYYGGCYASGQTGLTFKPHLMGPATGRRVADKLKWVRLLSGKDLDARDEVKVFGQIKAVRNHIVHFDPPCFAATIEDVAGWLSALPDLGWLLIKIRQSLGVPITGPIVQMVLSPRIVPVARDPELIRHPQKETSGYRSSTWKGEHPHRGRDPLQVPDGLVEDLEKTRRRMIGVLGRECTMNDVINLLLKQRMTQLGGMDNASFGKQFAVATKK